MKMKNSVSGPRWCGFEAAANALADFYKVTFKVWKSCGILTITWYFTVEGEKEAVLNFDKSLRNELENYNAR